MDFAMISGEERFQYEPLEAGQIRLITVFPLGWSRIGCQFLHAPLNNMPVSYTALSYVWGDPTVISKIYCSNRHVLGLTASAHYLLNLIAKTGVGLYFWIDLLCINQADDEEKGRQVRMMGDIFASAERVSAWLGEPSPDGREALHFIPSLMNAVRNYPNIQKDGQSMTIDELCQSYPISAWRALSNLLRRPWFQRIWVVQEAVRARHLTIFFDSPQVAINWDHLASVITILRITDHDINLRVYPTDYSLISFAPDGVLNSGIMNRFRYFREKGRQINLQNALVECRRFKSTKPHDMIYAMLGIVADAQDSAFNPDYTASVQQIFTQTTKALLVRDSSIQILHIAGIGWPRALHEIPSWVPDWTFGPLHTIFGYVEGDRPKYNAAGNSSVAARTGNIQDTLYLKGILLDRITKVSTPVKPGSHDPSAAAFRQNSATLISWLEDVASIANSSLTAQESGQVSDHLWRTLVANHERGRPVPSDFEGLFPSFIKSHKHVAAHGTTKGLDADSIRASERFVAALNAAVDGRVVFSTETGFVGLAPVNTAVGDKVGVFLGGSTPFAIRVKDSVEQSDRVCYLLVGECYVQGLMNGEGLEMREVQDICLV